MKESGEVTREELMLFTALWEKRSLTAAAEQLGIHLPKASRLQKSLRESFSDDLFIRIGNTMEPTRKASALLPRVAASLASLERLFAENTFDPAKLRRTFIVIANSQPLSRFGPVLLADLSRASPGSRVVFQQPGSGWSARLSDGSADAAVSPEGNIPNGFMELNASRCQYQIAMRPDHPLLRLPEITASDLAEYPECIVEASRFRGKRFLEDGRASDKTVVIPDGLAAPGFLLASDAWMVSCTLVIRDLFKPRYGLAAIPFPKDFRPFSEPPLLKIVWHPRTASDPAEQWFRGLLENAVKSACGNATA